MSTMQTDKEEQALVGNSDTVTKESLASKLCKWYGWFLLVSVLLMFSLLLIKSDTWRSFVLGNIAVIFAVTTPVAFVSGLYGLFTARHRREIWICLLTVLLIAAFVAFVMKFLKDLGFL